MKVAEILKGKVPGVVSVRPDETIATFVHRLRMARIGAMVVVGEDGGLRGISAPQGPVKEWLRHQVLG